MKYTSKKYGQETSLTASEIKRLLDSQEPPMGNTALAQLIGVTSETINSVVYRGRTPGVGMLNGIARALKLTDAATAKLFDLHEQDVKRNKLSKVTDNAGDGRLAAIVDVLTPAQIKQLEKVAMDMALASRKKK